MPQFSVIQSVTAAAVSFDLLTLGLVKSELQIHPGDYTHDGWLMREIRRVSAAIANECNRVFAVQSYQDLFRPMRGPFGWQAPGLAEPVQLSWWPVTSIASAVQTKLDGTTATLVADTDYALDASAGRLWRLGADRETYAPWERWQLTVAYGAGYASVPYDLEDAALRWITSRWQSRGRDPALKSREQPGIGMETFWVNPPAMSGAVPLEIAGLLDNYRQPVIA